jgi:hypothetical protein
VTATSFLLAEKSKFFTKSKTPDHLILSFVISAAAHDVGHPGFMNAYMVNTGCKKNKKKKKKKIKF